MPSAPGERRGLWRSRWAAIGAAVAVTFGAGGLFAANAASPESSTVAIAPVRILDTRDPVNVGLPGPFVSAVAQDLKVTGQVPTTTGTQVVVPAGATGVFLNVTPVGSTAAGFISVRPANATGAPTTSNVNFTAGAINPNGVLVELPVGGADDGKIEITFDAFGAAGPTADVLVDVVGYTGDTRLKALEAAVVDGPEVIGIQDNMAGVIGTTQGANLTVSFSTKRASRLAVSLNAAQSLASCASLRTVWLALDGALVPYSRVTATAELQLLSLTGVTDAVIPAGNHTLQMRNNCTGSSGGQYYDGATGTVTYISDVPSSATLTDDQPLLGNSEIAACTGVLSDDGHVCTVGEAP